MVHIFILASILLSCLMVATSQAQEPARLALLIGNKEYSTKIGRLTNPHNDVDIIQSSLKTLGFTVTVLKDATYKQMDSTLKRYVMDVRRAGRGAISFFYYSGHGVSNPDTEINYLVPVDVDNADGDNIWYESFQQNTLIDLLSKQAANATHYLIFDACRNELKISRPNSKSLGSEKGFAPVSDTNGLLIAYATAPKRTASDAGSGGGPYARVLAEELLKPGIEAVSMFRNVQIRVKETIGQDPWLSFPSLPPIYFAGRGDGVTPVPSVGLTQADIMRFCQAVASNNSIGVVEAMLNNAKDVPSMASCAQARLTELKAARQASLDAGPAQPAPPPKPSLSLSNLAGRWSGRYANSPGRTSTSEFEIQINVTGDVCAGKVTEPNTFADKAYKTLYANIANCRIFLKGEQMMFAMKKTYDGTAGVKHSVEYQGTLSPDGRHVGGEWIIGGSRGSFEMTMQ